MNQHSSSSGPAASGTSGAPATPSEAAKSSAPSSASKTSALPDSDFAADAVPTVADLFKGFLGLGLTSFGGALPLARRTVVERHRWLSGAEFTDLLGLCQFLPGGNVINLAVAIGMRFRGWRGALAGLLGLIAGPSLVVIALGVLYEHTQNDPHVQHLFAGLAAAAAGLLIAMAAKILLPLRRNPIAAGIAALGFVAIAVLRFPLLPTMLVLTPLSIALAALAAAKSANGAGR
ncbi:chromate transporter [Paraburkholderia edwinii]|jgi:chromate transporter|uniref:Chromate transporter n=1 Tax=Paraburkholderia edwinii TaxID=2861782 RepID=A0ABX8UZP2_9BURK|nr:chromate transporter [Paraburkholderia edwinii]QYD72325.1 chromate transporter [Paraburkholderia edwinii]